MTILLLNQFFWPDSAPTSQLLTDLARGLKKQGHDVYAISGNSNYGVKEKSNDPMVNVHRVGAARFTRGKFLRPISYASFFLSSAFRGLVSRRPDLVVTLTTPPLLSLVGTLIKLLRGSRHLIWEMDVYPDVAVGLDYIKRGGAIDKLGGMLADYSRSKADLVLALGACMKRRLVGRGVPESKIYVTDNWADGELIRPCGRKLANERFVVLYSGNLGLAHDTATICGAMRLLKKDSRFQFVFAGGGALRKDLEAYCEEEGVANAEFRQYSPREGLSDALGSCTVGLVTQRASCLGSVVPSKIYGLLAAGRPAIFIGPKGSTVADILAKFECGWQINNGDEHALVNLLKTLIIHPETVITAGHRARRAFDENFSLPLGVGRICSFVKAIQAANGEERLSFPPARLTKP